jgi:hypothetical protein
MRTSVLYIIAQFLNLQRDMRHSILSAQLIGKYRILWLRWSKLVSQVGKSFQYISSEQFSSGQSRRSLTESGDAAIRIATVSLLFSNAMLQTDFTLMITTRIQNI